MRATKLTIQILNKINPKTILYAEFAEGGAMGVPGTARIFTLESGKLISYLIEGANKNRDNERIYVATRIFLDELVKEGTLSYEYAGVGNHAYKAAKITFTRDDDHASFVYTKAGKAHRIPASTLGAYEHVVAKFAAREVSIEKLEDYLEKSWKSFSDDEYCFYKKYLEQIKRTDSGQSWFDFTVIDYYQAVLYLRHISGEDYLLNWEDIDNSQNALNKYRLKYVVDKIGWNKLDAIFVKLVKTKSTKLFNEIQKTLGKSVYSIYDKLETIKSDRTSLECIEPNNLENLFNRPVLVDFTKAAHKAILKDILERRGNSFNPDARSIALYFANYLLNEDKLPFPDVLPAVVHTIGVMPDDDFNHTHTDDLFFMCGEIIDHAWRYLEEDDAKQKEFRDLVYGIYWPRVDGLWPIVYRNKIEFKRESAGKIFDDAVSFVMSLNDIDKRNKEIKDFLDKNAEQINYKAGALGRRAFVYSLKGLNSEQEFERILEKIEPQDYHSYFTYPGSIKDAKLLLTELFRVDDDARITGANRLATFESLVITPNTMNVGKYILGYIDEHFDEFVQIVSEDVKESTRLDPLIVVTDFYVAMSKGVTEENEFPALKSIRTKMIELGCNPVRLTAALDYARKHRRTILFQRSALQKLF